MGDGADRGESGRRPFDRGGQGHGGPRRDTGDRPRGGYAGRDTSRDTGRGTDRGPGRGRDDRDRGYSPDRRDRAGSPSDRRRGPGVGGRPDGGNRTGRPPRPGQPGGGQRFADRSRPGQRSGRPDRDNRDNRGERGGADSDRRALRRNAGGPAVPIPESITEDQISREVKAELHGLPADLAVIVGRYLVASELEKDPEQAYRYAIAARDKAARIGVVREVTGIAAYRSGRWTEALAELRAARRLTGRGEYLPLMADSERALGRLDRALDLVRGDEARRLPRAAQIELRIVESGIRRDQGLADAAVLVLQVPELSDGRLRPWSARLLYAYGDALLAAGRPADARDAFSRAVVADEDEETDALARLDELDGITVDDLEDDGEDWDDE